MSPCLECDLLTFDTLLLTLAMSMLSYKIGDDFLKVPKLSADGLCTVNDSLCQ